MSAHLAALNGRTVEVARKQGDQCLLNRVDNGRSGLDGSLGLHRLENISDHFLLDFEDIEIADDTRRVGGTADELGDDEAVVDNLACLSVVVAPEVVPAAGLVVRGGEVKEEAAAAFARQAGMNAVRKRFELLAGAAGKQRAELLFKELGADEIRQALLLFDHSIVLAGDALEGVEVLWMDRLTEDTCIEKAGPVDALDLEAQALNQPEQALEASIRKHVVDTDGLEV